MLFKDRIHPTLGQGAQQEIGGKEGVAQQHVTTRQGIELKAQQGLLIGSLATTSADGGIEHCTAAKADQADKSALREPQSRLLTSRLGKVSLIGLGIRHDDSGTINQANRTTSPVPSRWGVGRQPLTCVTAAKVLTIAVGIRWRARQ